MVPVCLLARTNILPSQFGEIWPKVGYCMKRNMTYKGGIYYVFFPNIPELWKDTGECVINYKEIKEVLTFEDIGEGILKGYYELD